ncbi:MAG: methylaspartate mutase, partial [Candidatus Coatesbacteria bacterium]
FEQTATGATLVNMMTLNMIVGSGGVLSHAPRRVQAALMMIDGFRPEGVTFLAVDSIFMMPQLGVLSTVNKKAAKEVFEKDCLVRLGSCVVPVGQGKAGQTCVEIKGKSNKGREIDISVKFGEMRRFEMDVGEKAEVVISPAKHFNVGAGEGDDFKTTIEGGVVGIIIDARGRPLVLPEDDVKRREAIVGWNKALDVYPNM